MLPYTHSQMLVEIHTHIPNSNITLSPTVRVKLANELNLTKMLHQEMLFKSHFIKSDL